MLRRLLSLCAALLLAVPSAAVLAPAHAGAALTRDESRLLTLINDERASRGLVRVVAAAGTTDVARRWARRLSETKSLDHNPNLGEELEENGSPGWTEAGEEVGKAPIGDMDGLFRAYMNSPTHREVIIEPLFRYVGIGVVDTVSDGQAWNTLDFVDRYGQPAPAASPAPAPRQSRAPAPAPAPAATRSPPTRRPPAAPAAAAPRVTGVPAKPAARPTKPPRPTTATPPRRAGAPSTVGAVRSAPAAAALRVPSALMPPYDRTGATARAVALLLLCAIGYLTAYEWSRRRLVTRTA